MMPRRAPSNAESWVCSSLLIVIPAKAGIHLRVRVNTRRHFIPPPMRGNSEERRKAQKWIPAFAGMTANPPTGTGPVSVRGPLGGHIGPLLHEESCFYSGHSLERPLLSRMQRVPSARNFRPAAARCGLPPAESREDEPDTRARASSPRSPRARCSFPPALPEMCTHT